MGTISSEDLDYLFKTNSTTLIFSSKFSKHGLFEVFLSKNLRNVARLSDKNYMRSNYCDWLALCKLMKTTVIENFMSLPFFCFIR